MKKLVILLVLFAFLFSTSPALAHPGRLDKRGGHKCMTNCKKWGYKKGEWHKHKNVINKAAKKAKVKSKRK